MPENIDKTADLRKAIINNDTETSMALIHSLVKADLNEQDKDGITPLHLATYYGDIDIVKALIAKKVDLELKDSKGRTALHFAAKKDQLEVAEILIQEGANIDSIDKFNMTSLHIAVHYASAEFVEFLIKKEAKVDIPSQEGKTPLAIANHQIKFPFSGNVNDEEQKNIALKKVAVLKGMNPAPYSLVGSSSNSASNTKKLLEAFNENDVELATNLIKNLSKDDLENKIDLSGASLLHIVSLNGQTEIIKLLLDKGVNVNVKNDNGNTPLNLSALNGETKTVNFLLTNGANPNLEDKQLNTPLHYAVFLGEEKAVEDLLKAGANVYSLNKESKTTLDIANTIQDEAKRNAITKLLTTQKVAFKESKDKASLSTPEVIFLYNEIIDAIEKNNLESIKTKIERLSREDLNYQDEKGNSLLHFAVVKDRSDIVEFLLQNQADVNQVNIKGSSPLQIAAYGEKKEIVTILLKHEAKVDQINEKTGGVTALHLASFKGNVDIVRELLKYGAQVNILQDNKENAIHLANQGRKHFNKGNHLEVIDKYKIVIRILKYREKRQLLGSAKKVTEDSLAAEIPVGLNSASFRKKERMVGSSRDKSKFWSSRPGSSTSKTLSSSFEAEKEAEKGVTNPRKRKIVEVELNQGESTRSKALFKAKNLLTRTRIRKTVEGVSDLGVSTRSKALKLKNPYEIIPISLQINPIAIPITLHDNQMGEGDYFEATPVTLHDNQMWEGDYFEATRLLSAVIHGNSDLVKNLLENRVDVNEREERHKITPLHFAVQKGDKDIIEILLLAGANPNVKDIFHRTPLHYAIDGDNKDVIRLIMNAEIAENEKNVGSSNAKQTSSSNPYKSWSVLKSVEDESGLPSSSLSMQAEATSLQSGRNLGKN